MLTTRRFILAGCAALSVATACAPQRVEQAPAPPPTPVQTAVEPVRGTHGMVVSANALASDVGAAVLSAGGNAVDAAVATGLALAVVHPAAGNIADGRVTAIDFREKAPIRAHPEMFVDPATGEYSSDRHHNSHLAVGVPGTVAGFDHAHRRYGSMAWDKLVDPAVALARDGIRLTPGLARSLRGALTPMQRYPASIAAFSKNGVPYEEGELWRQPDLAQTLDRIRTKRRDGFYTGETAEM